MLANDSLPNPYVDLKFPLFGDTIPFNHGYPLYGAISHQFPVIHDLETLSIHPITGKPEFPHLLHLTEDSSLCLRLPINQVPLIYRLAGKTLTLNQHKIRLGLPESQFITPHHHLYSRLVVIKGFDDPQPFLEAAQRQLNQRNITANLSLITRPQGEPIRRIIKVKKRTLVGYGVKISDLNEQDSISLQEQGIGGKHKMGCGVFLPCNHRRN
ncbi:type I-MYXAN CRISPR-associated protein Cas6/Cmx6 [Crocosphaera sp.]|uniref:type I-MYXAN CRISPR-associated protein Cas6/Cmx6 n=1 Tax=Crocosphaera sp. TaxID=2729996 RepID=UPI003F25BB15